MSSLTCLGVEHKDIGSRPEQFLEVFVVADLLYERRNLHRLQNGQQPHLVKGRKTNSGHQISCVVMQTHNH